MDLDLFVHKRSASRRGRVGGLAVPVGEMRPYLVWDTGLFAFERRAHLKMGGLCNETVF